MAVLDWLSALATPLTGIINGISNAFAQDSANETNIALARENREWNEKMWNLNNEYNLPIKQIERLKQAGLNPNLMYGQGTVGNSSSPSQGVSSPRVDPVNYLQGITGVQDAILKMEQAKLIEAQRKKIEGATVPNDVYLEGFKSKTEQMKQAVETAKHNVSYLEQLTELVKQQVYYYGSDKSATWNMMQSQIDQAWKRLEQDAAKIAVQEYVAQTGRQLSTAQRHYLGKMAEHVGEKIKAVQRENRIGDESEPGEILKRLAQGLVTWSAAQQGQFNADYQGAQRIFDNIMKSLHEVSYATDAIIPF